MRTVMRALRVHAERLVAPALAGVLLGVWYASGAASFREDALVVALRLVAVVGALVTLYWRADTRGWRDVALRWGLAWTIAHGVALAWLLGACRHVFEGREHVALGVYALVVLYYTLFAGLIAGAATATGVPVRMSLPVLWLTGEIVRERLLGRFAWCDLGYVLHAFPPARHLAASVGVQGVGALLLAVSGLLATTLEARESRRRLFHEAAAILAVCVGLYAWSSTTTPRDLPRTVQVALLHAGTGVARISNGTSASVFNAYRDLAARASEHAEVVVWAEDVYLRPLRVGIGSPMPHVGALGAWQIIGARRVDVRAGRVLHFNSLVTVDPRGTIVAFHDKARLVPIVEAPLVGAGSAGAFTSGAPPVPLPVPGTPEAFLCYEVSAPRSTTADAAGYLIVSSSERFQNDSAEPWQQLAQAQFRAAEEGRALVRVTTIGPGAVLAADGSVRALIEGPLPGFHIAQVTLRTDRTPYAKYGPWASYLGCISLLVFALRRRINEGGS